MADKDPYIYRIRTVNKIVDSDTIDAYIGFCLLSKEL